MRSQVQVLSPRQRINRDIDTIRIGIAVYFYVFYIILIYKFILQFFIDKNGKYIVKYKYKIKEAGKCEAKIRTKERDWL